MITQPVKSTRNYQQARQAIDYLQRSFGDNFQGRKGRRNRPFPGWFWGIVQSAGPAGEADFSDARYWVQEAVPSPYLNTSAKTGQAPYLPNGSGNRTIQLITDPLNPVARPPSSFSGGKGQPYWVPATNLAELPSDYTANGPASTSGTHNLAAGAIALVICMPDPNQPVNKWYAFLPTTFGGGAISPGQLQDQVFTMIGQNQTGWSFGPLAHPLF